MPYFGASPSSTLASADLNGQALILDADADTTITADTDDQIDIRIAGADDFRFTANTLTALSGSTIAAQALTGTTGIFSSDVTGLTLNATGDTSASDNAALGYTSVLGAILTGQGSTNDVTLVNDADATVLGIPTGTTTVAFAGDVTLPSAGELFIGDTANAGVTTGLTISQGAADDEIFALKSSDVSHGYTDSAETDTYFKIMKSSAANGGTRLKSYNDTGQTGFHIHTHGQGGTATPSTTAEALFLVYSARNDGGNSLVNMSANEVTHVFQVHKGGSAVSIVQFDEDGDIHVDGSTSLSAYDEFDDAALIRTFETEVAPDKIIKTEFDKWIQYNKQSLVSAKILADVDPNDPTQYHENGMLARPLVNVTQLQRLQNGAIVQQRAMFETMKQVAEEMLPGFANKLNERLESQSLPALPA